MRGMRNNNKSGNHKVFFFYIHIKEIIKLSMKISLEGSFGLKKCRFKQTTVIVTIFNKPCVSGLKSSEHFVI